MKILGEAMMAAGGGGSIELALKEFTKYTPDNVL
jgi:hypothetical protein